MKKKIEINYTGVQNSTTTYMHKLLFTKRYLLRVQPSHKTLNQLKVLKYST